MSSILPVTRKLYQTLTTTYSYGANMWNLQKRKHEIIFKQDNIHF